MASHHAVRKLELDQILSAPCESAVETANRLAQGRGIKVKLIDCFRNQKTRENERMLPHLPTVAARIDALIAAARTASTFIATAVVMPAAPSGPMLAS